MTSECAAGQREVWGDAGRVVALGQIAKIVDVHMSELDIVVADDGQSFRSTDGAGGLCVGIRRVTGELRKSIVALRFELVRAAAGLRVEAQPFFESLSELKEQGRVYCEPSDDASGDVILGVELQVGATPMSVTREQVLADWIQKLECMARELLVNMPRSVSHDDLVGTYKRLEDALTPVMPLPGCLRTACSALNDWAKEMVEFLSGGVSIALATPYPITSAFALAELAAVLGERGASIGRLVPPMIPAPALLELARKAPGVVAVPASALSFGSSPYELGSVVESLFSALDDANKPVIFVGEMGVLQRVFHGGQGGANDPLRPLVQHPPSVALDTLATFAVRTAAELGGGLPSKAEEEVTTEVMASLGSRAADARRLLPIVARQAVAARQRSHGAGGGSVGKYVESVGRCHETLTGLNVRSSVSRKEAIQERFARTVADPDLAAFLKERLLGQDSAIDKLVAHLQTETLARPMHQPLRWCAQGTPGTGKTESAILIAERMGIDYMNIDAASMPTFYTATSQLLGSARGIVGSHQAGRLEQAAKHHEGVLIELSDIDHTSPSVRGFLADLFLQVLDTGEAQSSTGAVFPCSNLVFAFTMNLPGGQDEALRRSMGFGGEPSSDDVVEKATTAIKEMLSGAFLSRVGTPILFDPLDEATWAEIVSRAIHAAVTSALGRVGCEPGQIVLAPEVGSHVVSKTRANAVSYGARVLMERARLIAVQAVLALDLRPGAATGGCFLVSPSASDGVEITIT
jgi:Cdc48 subfamily AAA family protein